MSRAIIEACESTDGRIFRVTHLNDQFRFQQKVGSVFKTKVSVSAVRFKELTAALGLAKVGRGTGEKLRKIVETEGDKATTQVQCLQRYFAKIAGRHSARQH